MAGPSGAQTPTQVIAGNSGATAIPAASTRYCTAGLVNSAQPQVYLPAARRGRFRRLQVATPGAPGAGESWVFTLQKLFTDTALTCTISGAGSNEAADLANSVVFEPMDRWCIKITSSTNAPALVNAVFSMLFDPLD